MDAAAFCKTAAAAISRDCHPLALWCVEKGLTENVMKRPANLLLAACLATLVAGAAFEVTAAAADAVATQDLVNVKAAGQVTASWTKHGSYYALQVILEPSRPR